MKMRGE
jgi:hypothetical protein